MNRDHPLQESPDDPAVAIQRDEQGVVHLVRWDYDVLRCLCGAPSWYPESLRDSGGADVTVTCLGCLGFRQKGP